MTTTLTDRSACDIAEGVQSGRLSAVEVTRQSLARIDSLDERLGAFRSVRREAALVEARAIDNDPRRARLPLAGVPVAIKDNIAVSGEQVRHGSAATSESVVEQDDELVRRLRAAGAVIVGITRMPELAAWAFTSSAAFGVTRNPWNPDLDPGGSTGGGAVAVATGMAALALGTDGGGSLRIPAAYCGLVGVKPGRGVLPLPGGVSEHWFGLSVSGTIARTAQDAARAFAVLQNAEPTVLAGVGGPLRVAVSLRSPVPTSRADAHQRRAIHVATQRLAAAGHQVVRVNPPYPPTLIQRWSRRWWAGIAVEAAQLGLRPEQLEPRTRAMIRKGQRVLRFGGPRASVADSWRDNTSRWLAQYDVLMTPTVATVPGGAGALNGRRYLPTFLAAGKSVPYTQAWNLAGLPAVSVPVGVHDGLPLAVQLIGPFDAERRLLSLAAQLEAPAHPPLT